MVDKTRASAGRCRVSRPTQNLEVRKGEALQGGLPAECGNICKQRGTPENLWPKFILKGAPLRATSSARVIAPRIPLLSS